MTKKYGTYFYAKFGDGLCSLMDINHVHKNIVLFYAKFGNDLCTDFYQFNLYNLKDLKDLYNLKE